MDKEHTIMLMDRSTREIGKMINKTAMAYFISKMAIALKVTSRIPKEQVRDCITTLLVINMRVNIKETKEVALEHYT